MQFLSNCKVFAKYLKINLSLSSDSAENDIYGLFWFEVKFYIRISFWDKVLLYIHNATEMLLMWIQTSTNITFVTAGMGMH